MGLINRANTQTSITELSTQERSSIEYSLAGGVGKWSTRAYDLMETLLLDQYSNSVNFKLYMKAYLDELDLLMEQTHVVYLGRMLEFAEGRQLDIIGEILQQSRSILVTSEAQRWFGFTPHADARGFGNKEGLYPDSLVGNPGEAPRYVPGEFKSINWYPWEFVPMTDVEFRSVLLARGYVCNNKTRDINTTYKVIQLMLGRVPKHIKLIIAADPEDRVVVLELEEEYTTTKERDLILELRKWFIPMGVHFSITLI